MTDHDDATRALARVIHDVECRRLVRHEPGSNLPYEWPCYVKTQAYATRLAASGHGIGPLSVIADGEAVARLHGAHAATLVKSGGDRWMASVLLTLADHTRNAEAATLPEAVNAALKADR